jgi:hypothetical protein
VCARKQGIWQRSKQLKRSKVGEGHEIEVEVHELSFARGKCRHARGGEARRARARAVPGFAATLFSGLERCLRIIDIHAAVQYVSPCLLSDRADIHFTLELGSLNNR